MDTRSTYDLWQVHHIPNVLKQALGDDEASGERLLGLLLDNLLEDVLQILHIIVFEPPDSTATDLNALARSEVERLVRYDNISSLAETGNHTAYSREGLRVDDAGGDTEVCSDVGFGLHVNVLCAVETRGATGADTVGAQGLNGLVFEDIVGEEVVEVVRGKVRDGAAIGELRLGARRSAQCSLALGSEHWGGHLLYPTMMGRFSLSNSSRAVVGATSGSGVQSSTNSSISYFLVSPPCRSVCLQGAKHTSSVS